MDFRSSLGLPTAITYTVLAAAVSQLGAQTTLGVGDISFISAEADANGAVADGYSIVTWQSLAAGTVLKFTDNGMSNAGATAANTSEHVWTFTVGASVIAAGTTLNFGYASPTSGKWNGPASGTTSGNVSPFTNAGVSTSGDQLFVYQGTGTGANLSDTPANAGAFTGTLISGMNFGPTITSGNPDSNQTYAPTSLVNGNAYVNGGNLDNGYYNGARTGLSNTLYRAATNNLTNFTFTETLNASYDRTTSFTIASAASIHWDANGATAGDGGAGTWDSTTNDRFKNGATGTTRFRWVNSSTGNDHTAVFGGTAGTVTVSGGVTASGLQFDTTGYTLTASTITLSGSSTPVLATSTLSATVNSALAGTQGFTKTGTGVLTLGGASSGLSGTVNLNGGQIALNNVSGLGTGTLSVAAGAQSGTTNGTNAFLNTVGLTGSVTVANNITLPNDVSATSRQIHNKGGAGNVLRVTGNITGGGAGTNLYLTNDTADSAGIIRLSGTNTFTGSVTLNRGSVQIDSDEAFGATANNVTLNSYAGQSLIFTNAMTYSHATAIGFADATFNTGANNVTASGVISTLSGTIGIIKTGTGALTLSNTNTFNGGTTISEGTLIATGGNAITNTSAVTLANTAGATLQLNSSETIASVAGGGATGGNINLQANTLSLAGSAATSFAGTISGTGGTITKTSTSIGLLTLTGTNTYTGGTNLNGGALSLSNGSAAGTGAITIGTGATSGTGGSVSTILVNNTAATTLANNITLAAPTAATTYTLMKATASASTGTQLNLIGDISGGNTNSTFRLNSNTTGDTTTTYRLAGNNSFQGNLELYRGAIVVTNNNSLGSAKLLLNGNNNATLGDLRFENSVTLANDIDLINTANPDPIHTGGNTVTLSGVISATGDENLVKIGAGTLVFTGANTYGVGTTVSAGTLQIGNGGTTGNLGSGAVTNNAALVFNRSNNFSVSTTISGTGTVTKEGDGAMTLLGLNNYTGNTVVNDGTLAVNGTASASAFTVNNGGTVTGSGTIGALTVASGGRVGPGNSPGTLNTGTLDLQTGGFLDIELNGAAAGTEYDQLSITGTATLAGLLSVTMGFAPIENSLFFILLNDGSDAIDGIFTGLTNESVFNVSGQDFKISYFGNSTGNTFTGGNDVALMAIPEPSAPLLAGFALTALLIRRRR